MFKFRLPFCVRSERVTRMRFPLRLDGKHFPGVVKYGSRCFYFSAAPSSVAERAERRRFFPCANVAGNQIRLLEWNIELRFVRKLEDQYFLCVGRHFFWRAELQRRRARGSSPLQTWHFHEAHESPDAMLEVHDQVALVELTEIDLCAMTLRTTQMPARMGRKSSK